MKIVKITKYLVREYLTGFTALLPNDVLSNNIRRIVYKLLGLKVAKNALIYRNVLILGRVSIGSNSSISNNTSINGASAGVYIGSDVMIAPGCCIVAFDHGTAFGPVPMIKQRLIEKAIVIEDNVWVGANCTITKGVTIGVGAIIGANSVVTKDVAPYSVVGGVPARLIKMRN